MAKININAENVIKIDLKGKYIITAPDGTSLKDLARIQEAVRTWWNNPNDPILFMPDSFKLVRVDEPEVVTE